jgi:hypothetical protein
LSRSFPEKFSIEPLVQKLCPCPLLSQ